MLLTMAIHIHETAPQLQCKCVCIFVPPPCALTEVSPVIDSGTGRAACLLPKLISSRHTCYHDAWL